MDLTIKPQHISEMKENLNDLPTEILSHIFNLAAQDHGPVYFPISKQNRSPQLVISHVCSHWRRVALCTPELWSDTLLAYSGPGRVIDLHEQWLLRAGNSPVTLSIRFPHLLDGDEVASALQRISLPFQVKRLFLDLMYEQFEKLSNLPETTLSDLAVLELDISLPDEGDVNIRPLHFITRLQSLTLSGEQSLDVWFDKLSAILPWSQLRSVDVRNIGSANLHPIVDILRQIPMLQRLNLYLNERRIDVFETLTMPYLRDFQLVIAMERREFDKVLRCFTCPSLEKFTLSSNTTSWTFQTIEILKQQYNMHNLQEVEFTDGCALPVFSILQNAPMLRSLSLPRDAILDDTAINGISYGFLGRHLRRFDMDVVHNFGEVLRMVERRRKTANEFMKKSCSWREEITVLKEVAICLPPGKRREFRERVAAMRKAGITIKDRL